MAPSRSAPTTPQSHISNPRTPSSTSKHRAVSLVNRLVTPSPCPSQPLSSSDHPVEVIARIREHPEGSDKPTVLQVSQNGQTIRIRMDQGYRDFGLDGVSLAEGEDLQSFYKKYVESRIESVKLGGRCTVMMYGPTGAGKSHTMFGSAKEPGIAYRALQNILGESNGSSVRANENNSDGSPGFSVQKTRITVTILEVYNEEIFDLLAESNTANGHWTRPHLSRVRLEIMGKKAKNSVSITGTDAEKISKEIAKVEKRRVVKSTSCNERSSRSHCLVMLDVPALGGRLVLVDMAGSENLEQAGLGIDSKMQTGKINQGNIALKRVVEAIANGDSYIPFRDSKLTKLLQDSFEDDESKILMILCASPDPKDMHKTIGTLEYGCKAKCIVSLPASPAKDRFNGLDRGDPSVLEARVRAMEAHISKLEAENQSKDKEKEEIVKELKKKEQDLAASKRALEQMEQETRERCTKCCKDEIRIEMENRLKKCQKVAEEYIALGKKKLEEKVAEQQREIDNMRSRMKEIEREVEVFLKAIPAFSQALCISRNGDGDIAGNVGGALESISVRPTYNDAQQPCEISENLTPETSTDQDDLYANRQGVYEPNGWLPIIPEEGSEGEEEMMADDEDEDMVSSEKTGQATLSAAQVGVHTSLTEDDETPHVVHMDIDVCHPDCGVFGRPSEYSVCLSPRNTPSKYADSNSRKIYKEQDTAPPSAASRRSRIENIFLLCGNRRELAAVSTQKQSQDTLSTLYSKGTYGLGQGSEDPISTDQVSQTADIGEGSRAGLVARSPAMLKANPMNLKEISGSEVIRNSDRSPANAYLMNLKEASGSECKRSGNMSPARLLSSRLRHPFSENTPPRGVMPSYSSPLSTSQYSKSPSMLKFEDSLCSASEAIAERNSPAAQLDADKCEVYVKWETSKDSTGKLIKIFKLKRNTTLAELRRELEKQLSDGTNDFTFLTLGDPSGTPVEKENESRLLLTSLPDCHKQRGTKLACLRPHLRTNAETQGPLCAVENQMTWNTAKQLAPSPHKSPMGFNALKPMAGKAAVVHQGDYHEKTNQRLSFPLISQVKGLRL
eukprot:c19244_g1_i1 orf=424-3636(+)